ncbi:hypothetical protein SCP_1501060 [Sparassis crispa]|uniref:Uncharacterized protein n=1 Tax=Sparassis crispa TaxID=139825 RepID=A0A401H3X3_9APHY|nr:hypothetical protein SCP_1501060 [Sparassis crispa]GBE89103.1 hypothetical protein SCP_1501060 [Sparassis crispa]
MQHGNIREYKVVLHQNQQRTIIDFDRSERHECLYPRLILFDVAEPSRNKFGCIEFYQICLDCDVWTPNMVRYFSGYVHVRYSESPALLASVTPVDVPNKEALKHAHMVVEQYKRIYGKWADRNPIPWYVDEEDPLHSSRACHKNGT